jgi:hypothetical protein
MSIIFYILAGLAVLIGTVAFYLGSGGSVPQNSEDWARFGTYVGGIAGPLLSFLALIAVVRTMHLQGGMLELQREQQLADQHVRWLEALYRDIEAVLDAPIAGQVTLRAVLDDDVEKNSLDQARLTRRLDNLMKLIAQYCRAVAHYRDNISEFHDLQIHADRGGRFLDAIKPFHAHLGPMAPMTFEFCDMHLRGDSERAQSEAMTRSSR